MSLPTRYQFYCDHLTPFRILPGAPEFADIGICVIFQEDFNDAPYDVVAISSCSHVFHRKCIVGWAGSGSTQCDACPSCRMVMYEYVPLTEREIEQMENDEDQEAEIGEQEARDEALLISFDSEPEPQLMADSEDDATTAAAEGVAMSASPYASPHTFVVATSGSTPASVVDGAASALGLGDTSPGYSPSTPSYHPMSPEGVSGGFAPCLLGGFSPYRAFGSSTYTLVSVMTGSSRPNFPSALPVRESFLCVLSNNLFNTISEPIAVKRVSWEKSYE